MIEGAKSSIHVVIDSWGLSLLSQCREVLIHAMRKNVDIKIVIPPSLIGTDTFHGLPSDIKIRISDISQNVIIFDDSEILMINSNNGKGAIFHSTDILGTTQVKSFDQIWKNGTKISNLADMTKSDAQETLKAIQAVNQDGLGYVLNSILNSKNKGVDFLNFLNKNGIDYESKTLDEIISLIGSTLDITCSGQLRYEPNPNHFVIESKINSGHSIPWALLLEGYLNKKGIKTKMIYSDQVPNGERIHIKVDSKISLS
jgi:hypothetical protein